MIKKIKENKYMNFVEHYFVNEQNEKHGCLKCFNHANFMYFESVYKCGLKNGITKNISESRKNFYYIDTFKQNIVSGVNMNFEYKW